MQPQAVSVVDNSTSSSKRRNLALIVLMCACIFTNADRALMSILIQDVKIDLKLTDAEIGFIFGTATSLFYALFSLPIARLADLCTRKTLLSVGVACCAGLIAFTLSAKQFITLALFRVGVGVGESTVAPAALSMIADYFPLKWRTTAMAVFASGVSTGAGIGLAAGGIILQVWKGYFPDPALAPFGLKGWQVCLLALAFSGLILSYCVAQLTEPARPVQITSNAPVNRRPYYETWLVFLTLLPIASLAYLYQLAGIKALAINLLVGIVLLLLGILLVELTNSVAQWTVLFVAFYCIFGWLQSLRYREPLTYSMLFGCRTLRSVLLGLSCFIFVFSGVGTWLAVFYQRRFEIETGELGLSLGFITAFCGCLGTLLGGYCADRTKQYSGRMPCFIMMLSVAAAGPLLYCMLAVSSLQSSLFFYALYVVFCTLWYGISGAIITQLVLPDMRATAIAFFSICTTFLGFALGPYLIGFTSDLLAHSHGSDALRQSLLLALLMLVPAFLFLYGASRTIVSDISSTEQRAEAIAPVMSRACKVPSSAGDYYE
jgi:MFS family permease